MCIYPKKIIIEAKEGTPIVQSVNIMDGNISISFALNTPSHEHRVYIEVGKNLKIYNEILTQIPECIIREYLELKVKF